MQGLRWSKDRGAGVWASGGGATGHAGHQPHRHRQGVQTPVRAGGMNAVLQPAPHLQAQATQDADHSMVPGARSWRRGAADVGLEGRGVEQCRRGDVRARRHDGGQRG